MGNRGGPSGLVSIINSIQLTTDISADQIQAYPSFFKSLMNRRDQELEGAKRVKLRTDEEPVVRQLERQVDT